MEKSLTLSRGFVVVVVVVVLGGGGGGARIKFPP